MVMIPEVNPTLVGVKVTFTVQVLPEARLPLQLSVSAKFPWIMFPVKMMVPALGSAGSLKIVTVIGALVWWTGTAPKFNPALGVILKGLGTFALNSTGKRPLSISQFDVVELVHCSVFNSRK